MQEPADYEDKSKRYIEVKDPKIQFGGTSKLVLKFCK